MLVLRDLNHGRSKLLPDANPSADALCSSRPFLAKSRALRDLNRRKTRFARLPGFKSAVPVHVTDLLRSSGRCTGAEGFEPREHLASLGVLYFKSRSRRSSALTVVRAEVTGAEGFEPPTVWSEAKHSVQAELSALYSNMAGVSV